MLLPAKTPGFERQFAASIASSLSLGIAGSAFVWFAPLMLELVSEESPIPMTTEQSSWLVSSYEIATIAMALPAGILCDKLGRKPLILLCGPLSIGAYLLQTFIPTLTVLFIARQVLGICNCIAFTCCPIYIAEVSHPNIRGLNSCIMMTMYYLGCLISYSMGPYMSFEFYTVASIALPVLFTTCFACMPESPYYLLLKGENEKARQSLSWLRGGTFVEEELVSISDTVKEETSNKGSWIDLFRTRKDQKAFLIVQIGCITKTFCGGAAFFVYMSETFGESTIAYLDNNQLSIVVAVILVLASLSSIWMSDFFGRRTMIINSALLAFLFNLLLGGYYFVDSKGDIDLKPYVSILYMSIIGFILASTTGIQPLMQTIQAEYFSVKTRALGGGLTSIVGGFAAFLVVKQYQFIMDTVGVYLNYWIYAVVSLWGAVCMYFLLPETASRSLGEIQREMSEKK